MSDGGSAPSTTTTISKSEPPEYVKPYSIQMMDRGAALSNAPYESYQGQRIADFTPQQIEGLQMTEDRARLGSPLANEAQNLGMGTLQGGYLGPGMGDNAYAGSNPYLEGAIDLAQRGMIDNYQDVITPQMAAAQRASGAFGNSGLQEIQLKSQEDLMRGIGDIENQMRMGDYGMQAQLAEAQLGRQQSAWDAERANQMRTMSLAPQYANMDYSDAQKLLGVGDIYRDYDQTNLNLAEQDWMSAQQWPYQQLDVLANSIRTSMGGGGTYTSSAPERTTNQTANMLGGGMMGYGIGNQMFDSPYGGTLGALGGGLMGLWS